MAMATESPTGATAVSTDDDHVPLGVSSPGGGGGGEADAGDARRSRKAPRSSSRSKPQADAATSGAVDGTASGNPGRTTKRRSRGSRAALARPVTSFAFRERVGRIDLRSVMRVDLHRVVETVDIDTLQAHLRNITFGRLERADLKYYSDEHVLKLFQLAQFTIEYLINVQNTLHKQQQHMRRKVDTLATELAKHQASVGKREEDVKALKRELRARKRTIRAYETLLMSVRPSEPDPSVNAGETPEAKALEEAKRLHEKLARERLATVEEARVREAELAREMEERHRAEVAALNAQIAADKAEAEAKLERARRDAQLSLEAAGDKHARDMKASLDALRNDLERQMREERQALLESEARIEALQKEQAKRSEQVTEHLARVEENLRAELAAKREEAAAAKERSPPDDDAVAEAAAAAAAARSETAAYKARAAAAEGEMKRLAEETAKYKSQLTASEAAREVAEETAAEAERRLVGKLQAVRSAQRLTARVAEAASPRKGEAEGDKAKGRPGSRSRSRSRSARRRQPAPRSQSRSASPSARAPAVDAQLGQEASPLEQIGALDDGAPQAAATAPEQRPQSVSPSRSRSRSPSVARSESRSPSRSRSVSPPRPGRSGVAMQKAKSLKDIAALEDGSRSRSRSTSHSRSRSPPRAAAAPTASVAAKPTARATRQGSEEEPPETAAGSAATVEKPTETEARKSAGGAGATAPEAEATAEPSDAAREDGGTKPSTTSGSSKAPSPQPQSSPEQITGEAEASSAAEDGAGQRDVPAAGSSASASADGTSPIRQPEADPAGEGTDAATSDASVEVPDTDDAAGETRKRTPKVRRFSRMVGRAFGNIFAKKNKKGTADKLAAVNAFSAAGKSAAAKREGDSAAPDAQASDGTATSAGAGGAPATGAKSKLLAAAAASKGSDKATDPPRGRTKTRSKSRSSSLLPSRSPSGSLDSHSPERSGRAPVSKHDRSAASRSRSSSLSTSGSDRGYSDSRSRSRNRSKNRNRSRGRRQSPVDRPISPTNDTIDLGGTAATETTAGDFGRTAESGLTTDLDATRGAGESDLERTGDAHSRAREKSAAERLADRYEASDSEEEMGRAQEERGGDDEQRRGMSRRPASPRLRTSSKDLNSIDSDELSESEYDSEVGVDRDRSNVEPRDDPTSPVMARGRSDNVYDTSDGEEDDGERSRGRGARSRSGSRGRRSATPPADAGRPPTGGTKMGWGGSGGKPAGGRAARRPEDSADLGRTGTTIASAFTEDSIQSFGAADESEEIPSLDESGRVRAMSNADDADMSNDVEAMIAEVEGGFAARQSAGQPASDAPRRMASNESDRSVPDSRSGRAPLVSGGLHDSILDDDSIEDVELL